MSALLRDEAWRTEVYCREHSRIEGITKVLSASRLGVWQGAENHSVRVELQCGRREAIITSPANLAAMRALA